MFSHTHTKKEETVDVKNKQASKSKKQTNKQASKQDCLQAWLFACRAAKEEGGGVLFVWHPGRFLFFFFLFCFVGVRFFLVSLDCGLECVANLEQEATKVVVCIQLLKQISHVNLGLHVHHCFGFGGWVRQQGFRDGQEGGGARVMS